MVVARASLWQLRCGGKKSQRLKPPFGGRICVRAEARTYLRGNGNCKGNGKDKGKGWVRICGRAEEARCWRIGWGVRWGRLALEEFG